MNIVKNLEVVVIAALAMTFVTAVATAAPVAPAAKSAPVGVAADANIAVVVVSAKRLTADQKMKSRG